MYPPLHWVLVHYTADMAVGCIRVVIEVVCNCTIRACSETHWKKTNMSGSSDSEEFYDAEDLTPNRSSRWKIASTSLLVDQLQLCEIRLRNYWSGWTDRDILLFVNTVYCTYTTGVA